MWACVGDFVMWSSDYGDCWRDIFEEYPHTFIGTTSLEPPYCWGNWG